MSQILIGRLASIVKVRPYATLIDCLLVLRVVAQRYPEMYNDIAELSDFVERHPGAGYTEAIQFFM